MPNHYLVSIPVEATVQDGVDVSITHKLEDGLILGDILRIRVEDSITYIDIEEVAEDRNRAIGSALAIAWRLVQLISLINNRGFEVSLAGIRAKQLPVGPSVEVKKTQDGTQIIFSDILSISDHFRITEHISTLEPLLPLWEHVSQSNNVVADGLELLYLGRIASNERIAFLAHWIALELLVEHAPGSEPPITVLQQHIPIKRTRKQLKSEMEQVLKRYIADDAARERLIRSLEFTKNKSDIDRWYKAITKSGVQISIEEIKGLREKRGAIIHPNEGSGTLTIPTRLRELVTEYLNALLLNEGVTEKEPSPNLSKNNPSAVGKLLMTSLRKIRAMFCLK